MKYERITERSGTPLVMSMWAGDSKSLQVYNRLAELEDKIECGELIERTSEECSAVRKQAVKAFAEKLRDKEFSAKIGAEWVAVVKSLDIDELVKEVCGE